MKLRHLLASAAVGVCALSPLAASADAAGFDAHSQRFGDDVPDQHIVGTIDIQGVHVYRTSKKAFVAVVTYKDLVRRPSTKWIVTFQDPFFGSDAKATGRHGDPDVANGVAVEYRIGPNNKTAAFGYQYDIADFYTGDIETSTCKGFAARPDFAANTITYTVPDACWTPNYEPAQVDALTRLFTGSTYRSSFQSYFDEEPNRTDQASGSWSWGGEQVTESQRGSLDRNPFYRH